MSLVVTSNVNISVVQVVTTTMSLVVWSNISVDQVVTSTMSLVVTSNVNISVVLVITTTMSLVVQSNVNISIVQALAYYYVTCRKVKCEHINSSGLSLLLCHLYISANLLSTFSTFARGDSPSVHNPVAPSCLLRRVAPSCP